MIVRQALCSALQITIPIFTCLRSHLGQAGIQTQAALAPGSPEKLPSLSLEIQLS